MSDLAAFLLARITEDEAAAMRSDPSTTLTVTDLRQEQIPVGQLPWLGDGLAHIVRWQPARVLAECEAKRQIVGEYKVCDDRVGPGYALGALSRCLRYLAAVYADHPDYRAEWKS